MRKLLNGDINQCGLERLDSMAEALGVATSALLFEFDMTDLERSLITSFRALDPDLKLLVSERASALLEAQKSSISKELNL